MRNDIPTRRNSIPSSALTNRFRGASLSAILSIANISADFRLFSYATRFALRHLRQSKLHLIGCEILQVDKTATVEIENAAFV
jgi:hypothetical protein